MLTEWGSKTARLAALGPAALSRPKRYGLAVAMTVAALGLRLAIAPQEWGLPYVTFFPAVTLAALFCGFWPGMLATALGSWMAAFFFIPPLNETAINPETVLFTAVFWADELVVCAAIEAMRRYWRRLEILAGELRVAHDAEREAKLQAEAANQAKSRFLAAASHDLRQPLQALRFYHAALAGMDHAPRVADILRKMDLAMAAGEGLLRSLLDISVLEAGITVPQWSEVPLRPLLAEVAERHRPAATAKGLTLRLAAGGDVRLRTDPVLLGRILDNLVANAIRYTPRGGVLLGCRRRRSGAVVEVWDTGIGIAAENQSLVFEEFFQVGNTERDRAKGVGLGLSVVRKTAALLGMKVSVRSWPGRGSVFAVALNDVATNDKGPAVAGEALGRKWGE